MGIEFLKNDHPLRFMFGNSLAHFVGEIKAGMFGVPLFEHINDSQRLSVMVEAAGRLKQLVENILAGVPEGCVSQIMGQCYRFGQVLVKAKIAGYRPTDLGYFDSVCQAGPVMVLLMRYEDLGFVFQTAEGCRMNDAVAVALERSSQWMWFDSVYMSA